MTRTQTPMPRTLFRRKPVSSTGHLLLLAASCWALAGCGEIHVVRADWSKDGKVVSPAAEDLAAQQSKNASRSAPAVNNPKAYPTVIVNNGEW